MAVVSNHMSSDILTASAEDRLADAARRMVERGVGAVLILAGQRLEGILTERDRASAGDERQCRGENEGTNGMMDTHQTSSFEDHLGLPSSFPAKRRLVIQS